MKTVTYDETKWALVPIEPQQMQLMATAFNLCGIYGMEFVEKHEQFARDLYSQMVANAPAAPDLEQSFLGATTDGV